MNKPNKQKTQHPQTLYWIHWCREWHCLCSIYCNKQHTDF